MPSETPSENAKPTILSIELGRWIAAVMVVSFHISSSMGDVPFAGFFQAGFHGVDYFFVLSGFLMFHLYRPKFGTGGLGDFLLRRGIRIYVPYWPILIVFSIFVFFHPYVTTIHLGKRELFYAFTLLPRASMPPLSNPDFPLISPTWTLTCELLFYTFIAFCLSVPKRLGNGIAVVWPMACLAVAYLSLQLKMPWLFLFNNFIPLFFLGGLTAVIYGRISNRWGGLLVGSGLAGLLVVSLRPQTLGLFPGLIVPYVFGLLCAALTLGLALIERRRAAPLWSGLWKFLGASSYSIYLIHLPLILALDHRLQKLLPGGPASNMRFLAYVGTLVLAGSAYCYWIERPLLKLARRFLLAAPDRSAEAIVAARDIRTAA